MPCRWRKDNEYPIDSILAHLSRVRCSVRSTARGNIGGHRHVVRVWRDRQTLFVDSMQKPIAQSYSPQEKPRTRIFTRQPDNGAELSVEKEEEENEDETSKSIYYRTPL
jgi:hypothetical protein